MYSPLGQACWPWITSCTVGSLVDVLYRVSSKNALGFLERPGIVSKQENGNPECGLPSGRLQSCNNILHISADTSDQCWPCRVSQPLKIVSCALKFHSVYSCTGLQTCRKSVYEFFAHSAQQQTKLSYSELWTLPLVYVCLYYYYPLLLANSGHCCSFKLLVVLAVCFLWQHVEYQECVTYPVCSKTACYLNGLVAYRHWVTFSFP